MLLSVFLKTVHAKLFRDLCKSEFVSSRMCQSLSLRADRKLAKSVIVSCLQIYLTLTYFVSTIHSLVFWMFLHLLSFVTTTAKALSLKSDLPITHGERQGHNSTLMSSLRTIDNKDRKRKCDFGDLPTTMRVNSKPFFTDFLCTWLGRLANPTYPGISGLTN